MDSHLKHIRENQRTTWNTFSATWKKWDDLFMDFLKPMGDEIVSLLNLQEMDMVLDVAAGTGEPALTIASIVKKGRVVMNDLAENMLEIARENAARRGLNNVESVACDVSELPFAPNTFHSISCRFGFMFFPDMLIAAKEMVRVLRPGGRIATSVWNVPQKNIWITAFSEVLKKYVEMPAPPPNEPGMFRCAQEGVMVQLFENAGLKNISVREVDSKLNCQTADDYWTVMTEIAVPVVDALSRVDEETYQKIKNEVYAKINGRAEGTDLKIEASAIVIYGEK
jgi:ubiquinone/menaquinone biosynthesis C-methylase UbiE